MKVLECTIDDIWPDQTRRIVQIVDARHKPSKEDQMMVDSDGADPTLILLQKLIRFPEERGQRGKLIRNTETDRKSLCFFSARTTEGVNFVTDFI